MSNTTTNVATAPAVSSEDADRIERVAQHIFAGMPRQAHDQRCAHVAFRRAAAFVAQADRFRASGLDEIVPQPEQTVLDDAFYPNLPVNHPYNLQTARFGSLEKIALLKRIAKNPSEHGISPESEDHKLIVAIVEMVERRAGKSIEV